MENELNSRLQKVKLKPILSPATSKSPPKRALEQINSSPNVAVEDSIRSFRRRQAEPRDRNAANLQIESPDSRSQSEGAGFRSSGTGKESARKLTKFKYVSATQRAYLYDKMTDSYLSGRCKYTWTGRTAVQTCQCSGYISYGKPKDANICHCGHAADQHVDYGVQMIGAPGWKGDLPLPRQDAWTQRASTVTELANRLMSQRVVHIRGTPASGKTTLMRLLHQHLAVHYPWIAVKSIDWTELPTDITSKVAIEELMEETKNGLLSTTSKCLFIDDAQHSYNDTYLWSTLIKSLQGHSNTGLLIVLATSYGSATGHVVNTTSSSLNPSMLVLSTPPVLNSDAQFTLQWAAQTSGEGVSAGLYLNMDEVKDLIQRTVNRRGMSNLFGIDFVDWLHNFTIGHVGAICSMIDLALDNAELKRYLQHNPFTAITQALYRNVVMRDIMEFRNRLAKAQFGRGLPSNALLQQIEVQNIIRDVIADGYTLDMDSNASKTCYKLGLLHKEAIGSSQDERLVFPSPVHAWYCAAMLVPRTPNIDRRKYPDPLTMCRKIVKGFKSVQLREAPRRPAPPANIISTSANSSAHVPPEAQYQDEFYRAACNELHYNCLPSPEFGIKGRQIHGGSIDFFFSGYDWGVELIAEGDRLEKHYERFEQGGIYWPWIQDSSLKDWIILDFRTTKPRNKHPEYPKLYHVVFERNYTVSKIYRASDMKRMDGFSLFENH